jgi:hypothetical protein
LAFMTSTSSRRALARMVLNTHTPPLFTSTIRFCSLMGYTEADRRGAPSGHMPLPGTDLEVVVMCIAHVVAELGRR